jgi:hypothetical protein
VAGLATMSARVVVGAIQPAFAWTMSLGWIGLFSRSPA